MHTRQTVQFAMIVALGVLLFPGSIILVGSAAYRMRFDMGAGMAMGIAVWGWVSVGMLAGWATHWWPRTRALRADVEIVIACVGSLAGGWVTIAILDRFSTNLDERTYHNLAMLSVPLALAGGVLAVLALRRLPGPKVRSRLGRQEDVR
jgi:hypothetical protein